MEIRFLPGRISSLTLLVLMSSVLTNYICKCTCMYIGTGAGRSTCSGTMNRFCSREVQLFNKPFTSDVY